MEHHDDDNRWDYDCPQFVDFTVPMPFNDGADQMFESTIMGEGPSTSTLPFLSQGAGEDSPVASTEPKEEHPATSETTKDEKETGKENDQSGEESDKATEDPKKSRQPTNIVTSLDKWRNPKKHGSTGPEPLVCSESSNSKKPRKNPEKVLTEAHKSSSSSMLTRSKSLRVQKSNSASTLPSDKTAAPSTASGSRPQRSHTRTLSQGRSRSNSVDMSTAGKSKGDASTAERPAKVPSLLKRLGEGAISSKLKSSEELEMERIKQLKKELQHKRQMAQESYKKAMSKQGPLTVHSKQTTVPQEFQFQSDLRLKSQPKKLEENSIGDFVKSLRSRTVVSPGPSASAPKKLTVPQPFHLTEKYTGKGSQASAEAKFESVAAQVAAFHRKTPERFRARARSGDKVHERGSRSVSPGPRLTQPHTPNLTARNRQRPTHYISHEQLEMQEAEEMKQNQFKAHPVNTKILNKSGLGVKKPPVKPPTEIEEFSLSSGLQKKKEVEEECFEFHAKPLNKKILEGPVGIKPVKPALPTIPQSPAFALKHRVRLPVELPEEKESGGPTRAKPVPHIGIPFQPKLPHQHTVPEPFSVEERSKTMLAQKEEKIKQILEEEKRAREFHAQPIPSHDPVLPEKVVKEPTRPEPFQLGTDQRGAVYAQEMAHKLTEEEEEQKRAAQFRAQPNRTIYKEPFIPVPSTKALTEVSDFELNSDRRAQQREEFEMRKKEREAELEGHRREREQRDKEEEEAAIARLRAEMVHRPNPIRHYAPVVIKPSEKPLTAAESPQFSDRLRAKVRL
ncbi:targeting protein for Xklp2-like isoform X3 [Babylonia areolata]|uniref:targeting protein for Xklp2-like isoform X3 n=1 Tax=Babylonia areolata TaxID=304850 RepID=UPI003FD3C01D